MTAGEVSFSPLFCFSFFLPRMVVSKCFDLLVIFPGYFFSPFFPPLPFSLFPQYSDRLKTRYRLFFSFPLFSPRCCCSAARRWTHFCTFLPSPLPPLFPGLAFGNSVPFLSSSPSTMSYLTPMAGMAYHNLPYFFSFSPGETGQARKLLGPVFSFLLPVHSGFTDPDPKVSGRPFFFPFPLPLPSPGTTPAVIAPPLFFPSPTVFCF